MKRVILGVLVCFLFASAILEAKERVIVVNGKIIKVNDRTKDKKTGRKTSKKDDKNDEKDEELYEKFLTWLSSEKKNLKKYFKDGSQGTSFLREVRSQSSIFCNEPKVASKVIATVSKFLYADDLAIQSEAVKILGLFKKNGKALQFLSVKLKRLSGKLREYESLQIDTINAIAGIAPHESAGSSALLVVVKRDFQATDKVKLAVLNAWSRMPNIGTVDTLIKAYYLMAPCPDYLDGRPPLSCDPPDQAKYMSWMKTKGTFYSTLHGLLQPDFDANLGVSRWKRWISRNRKELVVKFRKIKQEADKEE